MARSHSPERSHDRDKNAAVRKRDRSSPAAEARDAKRRRSRSREPAARDEHRSDERKRDNDRREDARGHERANGRSSDSRGRADERSERPAEVEREARPRREPEGSKLDRGREGERDRERGDRDRARTPRSVEKERPAREGHGSEPRDRERGAREPDRRNGSSARDAERLRVAERPREAAREPDRGREREREREWERADARPRESNRERDMREARERLAAREQARAGAGTGVGRPGSGGAEDGEINGSGAPAKKPEPVRQPLSLDELLKKRMTEEAALAKPRFLSKKEREELAKKEAEEAAAQQKAKADGLRQAHSSYVDTVERERRERERRRQDDERRRREHEREKEKQMAMIKAQYLGAEKQKKKVLKPSEKFRFNFDWEARDDTSRDLNPLYQQTHEAALLYGRGMRAGIDRREQKKAGAELERATVAKIRKTQGLKETQEDRARDRERIRAAAAFDDFDRRIEKHWTEKALEEMTERDWRIFREDFSIAYKGVSSGINALPIRNWEEAKLPEPVLQAVNKLGYKKPSPIQMAAIPLGLQFRDVIGVAETGSGKTAAFVLPMLTYIMKQPVMTEALAAEGPYAVIMAPTRELALQIEEEARKLAQFTEYRMVSVVGGQNIEEQGFKLRKGCEIIIATPGRLLDCLEQRYAVLNQCNYIVLDEADRMIDLGFEPQVMAVLDAMPSSNLRPEDDSEVEANRVYRTTYMFSATMPPSVERLARKYMRKPVTINIGSAGKATDNVTQHIIMAKDNDKPRLLEDWINEVDEKRVIVFVNSKRACDIVYKQLDTLGYRCTVLHSGKTQDQREAGMAGFREEKFNVLVATDVAGRGIDVPDVAAVINYDMPHTIEGYTHRIGRTGRAGKTGFAVTFLTMGDTEVFYDLKRLLEDSNADVPPQLARHEAAKNKPGSVADKPRREQITYAA